ncbi:MAG: hypothetical protein LAO06_09385 [Acidobacteriia bacterium]|nr:hypothetical protein [Terriglobia bacterium]
MRFCVLLLSLFLSLITSISPADDHHHSIGMGKVGTVVFPVSCSPAAMKAFPHAVAVLHSFAYEEALGEFTAIANQDPQCAMAYWGQAMTWWRPLWYLPDAKALQAGSDAMAKAVARVPKSEREQGFIAALSDFYTGVAERDHRTRAMAYRAHMEKLFARFPRDQEVGAFYALALLGTALPTDKTYADQRKAAAILEKIFTAQPDHPGAAHYIIHSFDSPELAPEALNVARAYAKIAPAMPHALHMPSHIFIRLGLWDDAIASNADSRNAAHNFAEMTKMQSAWDQELHAMDYLMYAYMQEGRDSEAEGVLNAVLAMKQVQPTGVSFYAQAAIPARFAVERGQWSRAAELEEASPSPETKAITHWARALGAAHVGHREQAYAEIAKLEAIRDALKNKPGYDWSTQVEIQRREAAAWLAHTEGKDEEAMSLMRSAVQLEESTDKHPVTPGPILPARDLLADLLVDSQHPERALQEYEASLKLAPHRLHALNGAAHSAQLGGKRDLARTYYTELLANCAKADARDEVKQAKTFLAEK